MAMNECVLVFQRIKKQQFSSSNFLCVYFRCRCCHCCCCFHCVCGQLWVIYLLNDATFASHHLSFTTKYTLCRLPTSWCMAAVANKSITVIVFQRTSKILMAHTSSHMYAVLLIFFHHLEYISIVVVWTIVCLVQSSLSLSLYCFLRNENECALLYSGLSSSF